LDRTANKNRWDFVAPSDKSIYPICEDDVKNFFSFL
jgi:hypothetical protein